LMPEQFSLFRSSRRTGSRNVGLAAWTKSDTQSL
jgi:hypothetical protein